MKDGKFQYQIRWKGYDSEYDEWLFKADTNCGALIQAYDASLADRQERKSDLDYGGGQGDAAENPVSMSKKSMVNSKKGSRRASFKGDSKGGVPISSFFQPVRSPAENAPEQGLEGGQKVSGTSESKSEGSPEEALNQNTHCEGARTVQAM